MARTTPGFVYLAASLDRPGLHKIGAAKDVRHREGQLPAQYGQGVRILHRIAAGEAYALEEALHDFFGFKRHRGEWFRLDEGDVAAFAALDSEAAALALCASDPCPRCRVVVTATADLSRRLQRHAKTHALTVPAFARFALSRFCDWLDAQEADAA